MTKIGINCSIGGFGLSNEGLLFYAHLKDLNIALYEEQENNTYKYREKYCHTGRSSSFGL